MKHNKKLVLMSGEVFTGVGYGRDVEAVGEVIFNTSMVGYQEISTDPSYNGQMIVMTYPIIGSYGINNEDNDSNQSKMKAFIVREYNDIPSNFRSTKTFSESLEEAGVVMIAEVDTRELTRIIRDKGVMKAMITDIDKPTLECMKSLEQYEESCDLVSEVSVKKKRYFRCKNPNYNVVCIDLGFQTSIIKELNDRKCNVTVVPHDIKIDEVINLKPDGIFITSGPGNPYNNQTTIETVKGLIGKYPISGIGLGCLIVAICYQAAVEKMKTGHHGSNYPVRIVRNGKIEITNQNHGYTITTYPKSLDVTQVNVIDKTIEGFAVNCDYVYATMYNSDVTTNVTDIDNIFDIFTKNMKARKGDKHA